MRERSCSDGANERRSHRTYHCMYGNKSCITDGIYSFMYESLAYTYSMFILSDTRNRWKKILKMVTRSSKLVNLRSLMMMRSLISRDI